MYSFIFLSLSPVQGSYSDKEDQPSCCINHPFSLLSLAPEIRPRTAHWWGHSMHHRVSCSHLTILYIYDRFFFSEMTEIWLRLLLTTVACTWFCITLIPPPPSFGLGIPSSKISSAGSMRSNPSGLTSPPSGSVRTHWILNRVYLCLWGIFTFYI